MSLQITGAIEFISPTIQVSEKFKKREFVIRIDTMHEGVVYSNYAKMQAVQAKCAILDGYAKGDMVKVSFNIKGSVSEKDGKI